METPSYILNSISAAFQCADRFDDVKLIALPYTMRSNPAIRIIKIQDSKIYLSVVGENGAVKKYEVDTEIISK